MTKPRVLLLNPPQRFSMIRGYSTYVPIGLLSIAAVIRNFCTVEVFDCLIEDFHIRHRHGIIGNYSEFSATRPAIARKLREFKPDIIGISLPISKLAISGLNITALCKTVAPEAIRVLGGGHATLRYETLLKEGWCDYCVVGEGEMSFLDLIRAYQSRGSIEDIPGIASWNGKKIKFKERMPIQNLDTLPYPAYDLIDMELYQKNAYFYHSDDALLKDRRISVHTSRGCPYDCIFCVGKKSLGQGFRFHSAAYVVEHLQFLKDRYGINYIFFNDDNISTDSEHYEALLDLMIDRNLGIRWCAANGFRADTLTSELIQKTIASGCTRLALAFESGNQKILNHRVRKNLDLKKSVCTAKECTRAGINVWAFFMIGIPGETVKNMKQTIDFAIDLYEKYGVMPLLFQLEPFIGTPVHSMYVEKGILPDKVSEIEYQLMLAMRNWTGRTNAFNRKTLEKVHTFFNRRKTIAFEKKHNLNLAFQKNGSKRLATVFYDGRAGNFGYVEFFLNRTIEELGLITDGPICKKQHRKYTLPENTSFNHESYVLQVPVKPIPQNVFEEYIHFKAIYSFAVDKARKFLMKRNELMVFRNKYVIKLWALMIRLIYQSPFIQHFILSCENLVEKCLKSVKFRF